MAVNQNRSSSEKSARSSGSRSTGSGSRQTQRSSRTASSGNRGAAARPVSGSRNGSSREKRISPEEQKKASKRASMFKEVTFLIVFGVSLILFLGNFIPAFSKLGDYSYFLFGHLRYIAPFIILVVVWIFLFYDLSLSMLRKFIGLVLALFAISGILAVSFKKTAGGLPGRFNLLIFHSWLKTIGTYIINVLLLAIAFVMFTEISLSTLLSDFTKERSKQRASDRVSKDSRADIRRQKIYEEQRKRNLEREAEEREELSTAKRENAQLEYWLRRQKESDPDGTRFTPRYGIGDTVISPDGPERPAAFSAAVSDNRRPIVSSYTNSGTVAAGQSAASSDIRDTSFIPKITVPESFFRQADDLPAASEPYEDNLPDLSDTDGLFEDPDDLEALTPPPLTDPAEDETPSYGASLSERELLTFLNNKNVPDAAEAEEPSAYETADIRSEDKPQTIVTSTGKIISRDDPADSLAALRKKDTAMNPYGDDDLKTSHLAASEKAPVRRADTSVRSPETAPSAASSAVPEGPVIPKEPEVDYEFPPISLLKSGTGSGVSKADLQKELQDNALKLHDTFATFGVGVTITNVTCGPTVTRYEIQPELGVKVSKIVSLTDDIKLSMAAADIRMEAPIPGKSAIGIEIPNKIKQPVVLRDMIESDAFRHAKSMLAFGAGRNIEGDFIIADIAKMPHVLVAGSTGSGKSVCINTIIMSIIYHAKPTEVKLIMVDPKVVELSVYNGIPHLLLPVVTDPKKAANALMWAVQEMEKRYLSFAEFGVRGIEGYNELIEREKLSDENGEALVKMPHILIIVDELADLMMVAPGDVENAICRLAQKARAAGIHLVLATQRPSVDVITGLIKANIPSRIAFAVSSGVDSRTILDMTGAEKLLGKGDMLYAPAGASKPIRLQGAFVSDDEVRAVVDHVSGKGHVKGGGIEENVDLSSPSQISAGGVGGSDSNVDEYFADAGRLVIDKQKASIGMLQRAFKLGFNRAARIVDQLCDAGVVGEEEGTKPRKVLMSIGEFENYLSGNQ